MLQIKNVYFIDKFILYTVHYNYGKNMYSKRAE